MRTPFPQVRVLAQRLLARERSGGSTGEIPLLGAERVAHRLGERISPLVGVAGFHLLFQRALSRSQRTHPWLEQVKVERDTNFALLGAEAAAAAETPEEAAMAGETLIAELIGLMARFIGAEMTIRLVRQCFPGIEEEDQDRVSRKHSDER